VVGRRALDEGHSAGKPPLARVFPAACDIRAVDVYPHSAGTRRGCQDPQQQLTPAAAVVSIGPGAGSGQFGGEPVSPLGGKRPVERQATRTEARGIRHPRHGTDALTD